MMDVGTNPTTTDTTKAPKNILFVGDTHCGGHYGLWPREYLGSEFYRDLSGAKYLADCWDHHLGVVEEMVGGDDLIDLLVLTGDLVEGKNRKSANSGLYTASLEDQITGAIKVLRPLVDQSAVVIRVDGTGYHEEFDGALRRLDSELGVNKTQQVFDIQLPGGILNIAHHPAGGSAIYLGTKLSKEAVWSSVAASKSQVPEARWIVRAHLHNYSLQDSADKTVCLLPCWKLADFHAKKVNYWAFQPDIGSVLMQADPTAPGGYRFRPILYDPLRPTVATYEVLCGT